MIKKKLLLSPLEKQVQCQTFWVCIEACYFASSRSLMALGTLRLGTLGVHALQNGNHRCPLTSFKTLNMKIIAYLKIHKTVV